LIEVYLAAFLAMPINSLLKLLKLSVLVLNL